ncbi:transcription factor Spi-C [Acomys russatus]|uniref:transcription factor Spi-C n=1 Tax=Acomys russatus TaxID=60746 RepID=UPI0021E2C52E|nr:transcription factor Spi-C [Acomys russatus]
MNSYISPLLQQTWIEQDRLGQAFEDAFEVLTQHSLGEVQYSPEHKNCMAYINHYPHVRGNSNCYGVLPTAEAPCNWTTVTNGSSDFYLEGSFHQPLHSIPGSHLLQASFLQQKGGKVRRKLRLFEYLFESLCNPEMASCIQWIDKSRGVFQFMSKNKEKLAELWGKKKGNRKPMTYQKMARALRNYARTGEVTKVRRKLTYQFSEALLRRLCSPYTIYAQYTPPDQEYFRLTTGM